MSADRGPWAAPEGARGLGVVLGLVFLLELVAITCVGRWGWWAAGGGLSGGVLTVGAVLAWCAVWGWFLSPRARTPLPVQLTVLGRAVMVGVAAMGAGISGWETLAVALVLGWLGCVVAEAAL